MWRRPRQPQAGRSSTCHPGKKTSERGPPGSARLLFVTAAYELVASSSVGRFTQLPQDKRAWFVVCQNRLLHGLDSTSRIRQLFLTHSLTRGSSFCAPQRPRPFWSLPHSEVIEILTLPFSDIEMYTLLQHLCHQPGLQPAPVILHRPPQQCDRIIVPPPLFFLPLRGCQARQHQQPAPGAAVPAIPGVSRFLGGWSPAPLQPVPV